MRAARAAGLVIVAHGAGGVSTQQLTTVSLTRHPTPDCHQHVWNCFIQLQYNQISTSTLWESKAQNEKIRAERKQMRSMYSTSRREAVYRTRTTGKRSLFLPHFSFTATPVHTMSAAAESRNGSVKLEHPHPTASSDAAAMDVDESPAHLDSLDSDDDSDDDDEIVASYPIYLHHDLINHLYLLASPFRPANRPYAADVGPLKTVRVKPNQKRVELEYDINKVDPDSAHSTPSAPYSLRSHEPKPVVNYDASSIHPIDALLLAGRPVPCKTNYAVGVWSGAADGAGPALHLTPLYSTLRLKPDLSYLDDEREEEAAMLESMRREEARAREEWDPEDERRDADDDDEVEEKKAAAAKPEMRQMTVRFKKKETEKSAAYRTASHAYIKQMEEKEQWIPLTHHTQQSQLAKQQRALLSSLTSTSTPTSSQPIPMNDREYLAYLNPTAPAAHSQLASVGDRVLSLLRSTRSLPFYRVLQKLNVRTDNTTGRDECWRWCERFGYYVQHSFVLKSVLVFDTHLNAQAMEASASPTVKTERDREREREHSHRIPSRMEMARDYLVCQFYHHSVVYRDKVASVMRLDVEQTEERLREMSERRQTVEGGAGSGRKGGWEWKWHEDEVEVRCVAGVTGHGQLLKQQEEAMKQMERRALWALEPQLHSPPATTTSSLSSSLSLSSAASSSFASSSTSAHTAAIALLNALFREHGVCSESYLLGQFHASPPTSPLASLTTDAFRALVSSFSLPITPQLFIRKSLANPAVDRYRSVIASLFATRASVKKSDVQHAIEECYGDDIPDNLYRKVMKEFATFHTGIWTLKTGNY